jgi:hypothetical protein
LPPDALASCVATAAIAEGLNIDAATVILLHGKTSIPPKLLLLDDPGTPGTAEAALRLSQLSVAVVADRDGDGQFSDTWSTAQSCFAGSEATTTECAIWESCLDMNFSFDVNLSIDPDDVPVLTPVVTGSSLSTGAFCAGGTSGPGEAFDPIAQGLVLNLLTDLISNNTPPLRLEGLDFGGAVSFQNPTLLTVENDGVPDFQDYLGLTGDVQP